MVAKKGWIRIAEAGIGAIIILSITLFMQFNKSSDLEKHSYSFLEETFYFVMENKSLVTKIERLSPSDSFFSIEEEINSIFLLYLDRPNFDSRVKICFQGVPCSFTNVANVEDILSFEKIIISANGQHKKVKIFIWRKDRNI